MGNEEEKEKGKEEDERNDSVGRELREDVSENHKWSSEACKNQRKKSWDTCRHKQQQHRA